MHSIADAILGAAALGDIGLFFPDNDQKNKDLDSKQIIELCMNEISKLDLEIYNIDATSWHVNFTQNSHLIQEMDTQFLTVLLKKHLIYLNERN